MKKKYLFAFQIFLFLFLNFSYSQSINQTDTRLLSQPAVSDNHIAFIYAEDLWVADKDGSHPRRITVDEGIESVPVFSPDGKTIAFSAEYDGNTDVYVVPVEGGIPKRLTWHPYPDMVRDFTPDGKKIMFVSQRNVFTNRFTKLFTVSTDGGRVEQLDIPNGYWATYSPDGSKIAYTPLADRFNVWKGYRGGTATRIWVYDTKSHEVVEIPKPEGGSNDTNPQWMGNKVYFRSDRNGEFNLYSYDVSSKEVNQLTNFNDFPVMDLAAANNQILFEQAGYLHTLNENSSTNTKLKIGIAADLLEVRPRFVSGSDYIRSISISPSGARAVADFRGEIVTIPAEKGNVINLTQSPGVHEKYPVWSPDGKYIAYFSDKSGEYALHIEDQSNNSEKSYTLDGTGFYAYPHWSPDSKKIAYVDNGRNLYVLDIDKGKSTKIAQDILYVPGAFRDLFGDWSADSNWIAYTQIKDTYFEQVYLHSVNENKSYPVSDLLADVNNPTFDPSGKYLYMTASTDAGPAVNWFDQSNQDMPSSNSIYLVTLQKEVKSPFFKENDVEKIAAAEEAKKEDSLKAKDPKKVPALKIDWDGLQERIVDVPIPTGIYGQLSAPKEGQLYYISATSGGDASLHKYDLSKRKDTALMEIDDYEISSNGEKMLYSQKGSWFISDTGKKSEVGNLNINAIQVKIDPKKEWAEMFDEVWRINRDYFYDPGMHGVDWDAMKKKYSALIPDVATKSDLYRIMSWMLSELRVGHHRFDYRGDNMNDKKNIPGGLLGADYEVANNRYRITKIYGGLNWNPEMRSPLTEPGVNVKVGDYILAVDGKEVTSDDNLYSFFENKADKIVLLTLSSSPGTSNFHKEEVTPVATEWALRNRDWVEGNIKKVDKATNGQVAYVYVPNTAEAGHEYFKRYFFPQADKKAIIVDERFNGGGQLADYYIDLLTRPEQAHWNFRYGKDLNSPSGSIQGPKVLLIDETAGSGGDYFPWMFRKFNVGTIIGKRTWGGLVGVLGYPELIDGGIVTAPNVAFYSDKGYRIENEGVPPDIEIEQLPKEVIAGKDPQLQKAIEVILQQLKENPIKEVKRPAYPDKTKTNLP